MTIARIGEFRSKEDTVDALREFIASIVPMITSSAGNISCHLYHGRDDPTRFLMIETWESVEAHQASVKNIPPEKLAEIRPLLGEAPAGGYFGIVAGE